MTMLDLIQLLFAMTLFIPIIILHHIMSRLKDKERGVLEQSFTYYFAFFWQLTVIYLIVHNVYQAGI